MLEKETQKHIRLENLLRMLSESSFIESSIFQIWSPGFLLSSPGFLNASPSTSPGFSRVRIFFGSESKSESESGPGFEICPTVRTVRTIRTDREPIHDPTNCYGP